MQKLERITIKNFKSIKEQTLELGDLNIFIGANGSGKSNFIEIFTFLRAIVFERLQVYVGKSGGADTLLHFGGKSSPKMELILDLGYQEILNRFFIKINGSNQNTLFVEWESVTSEDRSDPKNQASFPLFKPSDPRETCLKKERKNYNCVSQIIESLEQYFVYHFNDTSNTAKVKAHSDINDNYFLRPQGENLAAILYWLQNKKPEHYSRIKETIQQVAPFFDDFFLAPLKENENVIQLKWLDKGSDEPFYASSLSDGTLRFICLATLLLQPELPPLILLDEPELGLHPAAINLLVAMLNSASKQTQVIVATQSVTLLNQFDQSVVWAVERENDQTVFKHLKDKPLDEWLENYSLGELWEKNVLGARP